MVDLTLLTADQTAGLQFEMMQLNANLTIENERITQYNANRPVSQPEQPLKTLWTVQTYANSLVTARCDQAYTNLLAYKERIFKEKFYTADAVKQQQVLDILGVPPVVQ